MVLFAIYGIVLAAVGGSQLVILFSGAGFLSGLAAIATVYVTHRRNNQEGKVEDKSVAITELEKAVPGMGEIIQNWTDLVHSLQGELASCKAELLQCKIELAACRVRVEGLERGIGGV